MFENNLIKMQITIINETIYFNIHLLLEYNMRGISQGNTITKRISSTSIYCLAFSA